MYNCTKSGLSELSEKYTVHLVVIIFSELYKSLFLYNNMKLHKHPRFNLSCLTAGLCNEEHERVIKLQKRRNQKNKEKKELERELLARIYLSFEQRRSIWNIWNLISLTCVQVAPILRVAIDRYHLLTSWITDEKINLEVLIYSCPFFHCKGFVSGYRRRYVIDKLAFQSSRSMYRCVHEWSSFLCRFDTLYSTRKW